MTRLPKAVTILAAAVVVASGSTLPAQAGEPDAPPLTFTSDRGGDTEIYRTSTSGRLVQLTRNQASDYGAVWSPDGRRLAFVSDRDGDDEIYTMRADGTGVRQLTHNDVNSDGEVVTDRAPAWSPDGRLIAFASTRAGGSDEIWVMRADGSRPQRLTVTEPFIPDTAPAWSPDGRSIAFVSNRDESETFEIYLIRADGSRLRQLTPGDDGADEGAPDWSPDGRHIVYSSTLTGAGDVYVMAADGSDARYLAGDDADVEIFPKWTSDGRRIVFEVQPLESVATDIWVMDSDGTDAHPIVDSPAAEFLPDPRPLR